MIAGDNGFGQFVLGPDGSQHVWTMLEHIVGHKPASILDVIARELEDHLIWQLFAQHGEGFAIGGADDFVAEAQILSDEWQGAAGMTEAPIEYRKKNLHT